MPGDPRELGATAHADGVNFAVYSSIAERVELCLYSIEGHHQGNIDLPACDDDIWHGFLPGCEPGQRYGLRIHGPYAPDLGHRCNPAKLLIDPYARRLSGELIWHPALSANDHVDSGPYMPKCVVTANGPDLARRVPIPMADSVLYEANVRGFTMRHPDIPEDERGRFRGMHHTQILAHLKAMGITAIELMPVHAFVDEHHLYQKKLRNFWGYNSIGFFAPAPRYAAVDPVFEFRQMVDTLHGQGFEVILDVVYNHTAEGDHRGPTLSFRGIDNAAYYRLVHGDATHYINDTGCGNTLNADAPMVQKLVIDSLCYWTQQMGVDGFRFDLAPVLGRHASGFSSAHPLLEKISRHPVLARSKLIAEPWDTGPGGYQLGQFPLGWGEWNDQYRDDVRRFWRGDGGSGVLAQRLRGSSERFEHNGRSPSASLNFVTSHDGFTLNDVACYVKKHNEANGESNRDGHNHNYSVNFGIEGPSDNFGIRQARRCHRLNLLATLFVSQGTPMLLGGDELGHSQQGNNNAYAQDNEIGWIEWAGLERDPGFTQTVQRLIALRRELPLMRLDQYVHGGIEHADSQIQIIWLNANGRIRFGDDWHEDQAFTLVVHEANELAAQQLAVVFNPTDRGRRFVLDPPCAGAWHLVFQTSEAACRVSGRDISVPAGSLAIVTSS
ncbi:MAG: glycogen debranching protein GlgX [Pseudomonadota bacterium]